LTSALRGLADSHRIRVNCVVPDWIGLDRAHVEYAALSPGERASLPPLIPPGVVVDAVLSFVEDDRLSGRICVLPGGDRAEVWPP
jgi:hypothetical protein